MKTNFHTSKYNKIFVINDDALDVFNAFEMMVLLVLWLMQNEQSLFSYTEVEQICFFKW